MHKVFITFAHTAFPFELWFLELLKFVFCRNDFIDDKGCLHQASNMHGMYITMMRKLQVYPITKPLRHLGFE